MWRVCMTCDLVYTGYGVYANGVMYRACVVCDVAHVSCMV